MAKTYFKQNGFHLLNVQLGRREGYREACTPVLWRFNNGTLHYTHHSNKIQRFRSSISFRKKIYIFFHIFFFYQMKPQHLSYWFYVSLRICINKLILNLYCHLHMLFNYTVINYLLITCKFWAEEGIIEAQIWLSINSFRRNFWNHFKTL